MLWFVMLSHIMLFLPLSRISSPLIVYLSLLKLWSGVCFEYVSALCGMLERAYVISTIML